MKKQVLILIGVAVALFLAWKFLGDQEKNRQRGDVTQQPPEVDSLAMNRVVLSRSNQPTIVFEKDADGRWGIVEPLQDGVNKRLMAQLVEGLVTMRFVDLISERSSRHTSFQIDDIQAAHLQGFADDQLLIDVYLGKATPDRAHVYAREAGSDAVYSATGAALTAMRTRGLDEFRNRDMFGSDPTLYDSLAVLESDFGDYRVARTDTASWGLSVDGAAYESADPNQVDALIGAFARMRATGFAPDTAALDWSEPLLQIDAWRLGSAHEHVEFIEAEGEDNNYWVRIEGRPHVYKVFGSVYGTFNKDPEPLRLRTPES